MERETQLLNERALKKKARALYTTARWLSFLCVPWYIYLLFDLYRPSIFDVLWAAGVPALPYLLIIGTKMSEKDPFYSSHAKQAMFVVGLRVLSAAFVAWTAWYGDEALALWVFVLGNGGLWLFGNGRGMKQVDAGRCWWAERFRPNTRFGLSSLSIAELEKEITALRKQERELAQQGVPLVQARKLLAAGRRQDAIGQFAEAFRLGDAAVRAEAARELAALGEVETF